MQKRIEELRQAKEPCQRLELSFDDGIERPRTALDGHPAFSRLADSSLSGQQLASTWSRIPRKATWNYAGPLGASLDSRRT